MIMKNKSHKEFLQTNTKAIAHHPMQVKFPQICFQITQNLK
jgi:hypothetical protein